MAHQTGARMQRIITKLLVGRYTENAKKDAENLNAASMALRVRVEHLIRRDGQSQAA